MWSNILDIQQHFEIQVMSMDSRIANKDKTILSLQLEELEPVFMGEKEDKGCIPASEEKNKLPHFPFFTLHYFTPKFGL